MRLGSFCPLARLVPHGVGNRGRKNCQQRDKNSFREPLGFPASGTQGLFGSATVFLGRRRVPSSQQARENQANPRNQGKPWEPREASVTQR